MRNLTSEGIEIEEYARPIRSGAPLEQVARRPFWCWFQAQALTEILVVAGSLAACLFVLYLMRP